MPLDAIAPGDLLLVASGDVVPVDGAVASAAAVLDESALTGEARPAERIRGDQVRSGVVNVGPPFDLRASDTAAASTYAGIVRLVGEAERSQAPFVRAADRYAMWFLPLTLAVAAAAWAPGGADRAVAVLVVATPCPLILAAPVALVSGLSAAARRGVVVKSGGVLERLARCTTLILDKTGTLTAGSRRSPRLSPPARPPGRRRAANPGGVARPGVGSRARRRDRPGGGRARPPPDRAVGCHRGGRAGRRRDGRGPRGQAGARRVGGRRGSRLLGRTARRRSRLDGALTVFAAVDGRPAACCCWRTGSAPMPGRPSGRSGEAASAGSCSLPATGPTPPARWARSTGADEVLAELTPAGKLEVVRREQRRAPVDHDRRRDQRRPGAGARGRRDRDGCPRRHRVVRSGGRGAHRRSSSPGSARSRRWPGAPGGSPAERARRHGPVAGRHGRRRRGPAARGVGRAAAGGHRCHGDPQRAARPAPARARGPADGGRRRTLPGGSAPSTRRSGPTPRSCGRPRRPSASPAR